MTPLYSSNFKKLENDDPELAFAIKAARSGCSQNYTYLNQPNLIVKKEDCSFFIHRLENSHREAVQWIESLSLENISVLYVYGIGLGEYYKAALPWLKSDETHRLIFLENHLEIMRYLLDSPIGTLLLNDPQVEIRDVSKIETDPSILYWLTWDYLSENFLLTALASYKEYEREFFNLLSNQLHFQSHQRQLQAREKLEYGMTFFNNFYHNLLKIPSAYSGEALFNKFKNVPAIICGAGPSLQKHLSLLKELEDKALIIAPGSAMNSLNSHSIWPHLGVAIDPNLETFYRILMNRAFETPFFYRDRLQYDALKAIHGPRLRVCGTGDYSISKWFEKELDLSSEIDIDEGQNVVNFALDLAYNLGCNPIIFVGMDLSADPSQHYAPGIERHPFQPPAAPPELNLGDPLIVLDIHDKPVKTYWPWIAEANWLSFFGHTHSSLTLINSTEGGIGFFSIPAISLEEVAKTYLSDSLDIPTRMHQALQEASLSAITLEKIEGLMQRFYESVKRCEAYFEKNQTLSPSIDSQPAIDLEEEIAFQYLLKDFDTFYFQLTHRKQRELKRIASSADKEKKRQEWQSNRFLFLSHTLKIHAKIIENIQSEKKPSLLTISAPFLDIGSVKDSNRRTFYYPSGQLESIRVYKEGIKHGNHQYFYPNGLLKSSIPYKENALDGDVLLYYSNGRLKRSLAFKSGRRHGIEKSWYDNGQLFTRLEYKEGQAVKAQCWLDDGTLVIDKEVLE